MSWSLATLETTAPAAREITKDGICATKPSPIASKVYVSRALEKSKLCCMVPTKRPPIILTTVITIPATASPRTYLLAPSIAP